MAEASGKTPPKTTGGSTGDSPAPSAPAGAGTSTAGTSDPGKDDSKTLGLAPGGNPGKDDVRAGAGAKPAGEGVAQANAAEVAAVIKTQPAEVEFGEAELVDISDPDAVDRLLSDAGGEQFVTLDAEVVERFYFPDTKRPSHRVLFHKGQVVPKSLIEERAAEIRAAQSKTGVTIDTTTIASGTFVGVPQTEALGV